jgi:hypothetical protein
LFLNRLEEAHSAFNQADRLGTARPLIISGRGVAHAKAGDTRRALESAAVLEADFGEDKTVPHAIATIYASLGDNEKSLAWLEAALEHPVGHLAWLGVDPRFSELKDETQFNGILARLGIGSAVVTGR